MGWGSRVRDSSSGQALTIFWWAWPLHRSSVPEFLLERPRWVSHEQRTRHGGERRQGQPVLPVPRGWAGG